MVDIGELLGGDRNETEKQMLDVILFEQQLANVSLTDLNIVSSCHVKSQKVAPILNENYLLKVLAAAKLLKVIFRDESGQNLDLVKPTQYDGRSHVKLG